MERPDICFVSYGLYSYLFPESSNSAGGAERQQYLIARELENRGYNVCAVVGDYGQENHKKVDGIDVWKGYRTGKSGFKSPEGFIRLPIQVLNLLYTINKIDAKRYYTRSSLYYPILYFYSYLNGADYYCGLSHDRDVEPTHIESGNSLFEKLYLLSLSRSDGVISQTEYQENSLDKNYGIDSTIIKNGYEIPEYEKRNLKYFLWVGRADKESKNPEAFFKLSTRLPDHKFMMIAAPGQNDEYYQTLKKRGKQLDNVVFEGFVEPNEILQYYRNGIALINTSFGEGFPNTFLEAWSVGTPVISLNVDLDGLLNDKQIGKYSGTFEQLIKDATLMAENNALNSKLGRRGREYTISNHSIEKVVDKFEHFVL